MRISAAGSIELGAVAPTNGFPGKPRSTAAVVTPAKWRRIGAKNFQARKQQGFSLIELLIVIAIVLTIAAITVPSLLAAVDASKVARAAGDISAIQKDVALYQTMNNTLPDSLAQAGDGALLDPWGNPYQYLNHANMKGNGQARKDRFLVPLNDDYDLYSMGKDGVTAAPITAKASQDDIIRACSGSYIGLASQF